MGDALPAYNRAMKLGILTALLFVWSLAPAQEATDIAAEPHHHLLLENDQVRVFALTLHPDESAAVHLQHSFMTVTLQDGEIIIWDQGKSPIQHFQVHKGQTNFVWLTHEQQAQGVSGGFRNDRMKDYRNITIEFFDPDIGWYLVNNGTTTGLLTAPGSMFLGGAIAADVLLQPGDSFPAPEKPGAELVIPVSDVNLRSASDIGIRKSSGEAAWIPAGHTSALTNAGREPARFIIVEFQPPESVTQP
jgi:hypothetical protein